MTDAKLRIIERAESALRAHGFRVCRVRHHDDLARIELDRAELPRALEPEMSATLVRELKAIGYRYVTIDLQGYRTGQPQRGAAAAPRVTRSERLTGAVLGALFLALHLPFLSRVARGPRLDQLRARESGTSTSPSTSRIRQAIRCSSAAAKLLHGFGLSEVHALSLLGILSGALAVVACMALFASLDADRPHGPFTWLAALVVAVCPLFWFTAARPLSDTMGLAASLGVQALLVTSAGVGGLAVAAFLAAFTAGIRSQVVWLTLPLLVLAVARLPRAERMRGAARVVGAYVVGGLAWAIPLILVAGGPTAYLPPLLQPGRGGSHRRGHARDHADHPSAGEGTAVRVCRAVG